MSEFCSAQSHSIIVVMEKLYTDKSSSFMARDFAPRFSMGPWRFLFGKKITAQATLLHISLGCLKQAMRSLSLLYDITLFSISYWFNIVDGFCFFIFLILQVVNCCLILICQTRTPTVFLKNDITSLFIREKNILKNI